MCTTDTATQSHSQSLSSSVWVRVGTYVGWCAEIMTFAMVKPYRCSVDDNKRSNIFYTQNLNDHLVVRSVLCPQSITSLSQSNGGKQSEYLALAVKLSKCDRYFNPGAEIRGWFQSKAHRDAGSFAQYCLFALEICVPS